MAPSRVASTPETVSPLFRAAFTIRLMSDTEGYTLRVSLRAGGVVSSICMFMPKIKGRYCAKVQASATGRVGSVSLSGLLRVRGFAVKPELELHGIVVRLEVADHEVARVFEMLNFDWRRIEGGV